MKIQKKKLDVPESKKGGNLSKKTKDLLDSLGTLKDKDDKIIVTCDDVGEALTTASNLYRYFKRNKIDKYSISRRTNELFFGLKENDDTKIKIEPVKKGKGKGKK